MREIPYQAWTEKAEWVIIDWAGLGAADLNELAAFHALFAGAYRLKQ